MNPAMHTVTASSRSVVLFCLAIAMCAHTATAQVYHFTITPESIGQQEFAFAVQTETVEKEVKYRITVSPKDKPVPTNFVAYVMVVKGVHKVLDFGVSPIWKESKAVFTVALRADYIPMATIRFAYSRRDPKSLDGAHSVYFHLNMESFLQPEPTTTPAAPPEAPASTTPEKQP